MEICFLFYFTRGLFIRCTYARTKEKKHKNANRFLFVSILCRSKTKNKCRTRERNKTSDWMILVKLKFHLNSTSWIVDPVNLFVDINMSIIIRINHLPIQPKCQRYQKNKFNMILMRKKFSDERIFFLFNFISFRITQSRSFQILQEWISESEKIVRTTSPDQPTTNNTTGFQFDFVPDLSYRWSIAWSNFI